MKKRIDKRLKLALICTISILAIITSFVLYKEINNPGFKEEKISLYSYTNKANVNYEVLLKPNILYDKNILEEGSIYITEFVDKIQITFNCNFTGERSIKIKGEYDVIARAEGTVLKEKEELVVWKKDFMLLPKESFNVKDNKFTINKNIELDLVQYNEFAKQVLEASKVNANTRLTVLMNVNIKGETDNGVIEEKMMPSIIIPLNTSYFEILGNLSEEKQGALEETNQVQLAVNQNKVIFYGILLGILGIILILLIFFTESIVITDPLQKKLKYIFKKHGDRLVALNKEPKITWENTDQVKSIDDLVRIADEIGKPIIYKYSSNYKEITKMHVTDEDKIYMLDLNEALEPQNLDKQEGEKIESKEIKIES